MPSGTLIAFSTAIAHSLSASVNWKNLEPW
jgi:hypothetical protein